MPTGPTIQSLLATTESPELGPGPRANVVALETLQRRLADVLNEVTLSRSRAELVQATVLLWHDYLDAAHAIVQEDNTKDGSYIHAILHRREPDPDNAKYWFRRVAVHPCFATLSNRVTPLLQMNATLKAWLLPQAKWDPFAFVDACESVRNSPADKSVPLLREIQRAEFELLLHHLAS